MDGKYICASELALAGLGRKGTKTDDTKKKEKKYTTRVTKPKYWMTALIYFWCISPISCCNTSNQLIQNSTIPVSAAYPEFPGVGFTHTNMHTAPLFFTAGTNSMQTIQHHTTQELELRHCTSTTLTQASTDSSRSEGHPTHTVEDHFLQFVMMILVYVVIFVYYLDETYNTTHQRKRGSRYKHKKRRRRPQTDDAKATYQHQVSFVPADASTSMQTSPLQTSTAQDLQMQTVLLDKTFATKVSTIQKEQAKQSSLCHTHRQAALLQC